MVNNERTRTNVVERLKQNHETFKEKIENEKFSSLDLNSVRKKENFSFRTFDIFVFWVFVFKTRRSSLSNVWFSSSDHDTSDDVSRRSDSSRTKRLLWKRTSKFFSLFKGVASIVNIVSTGVASRRFSQTSKRNEQRQQSSTFFVSFSVDFKKSSLCSRTDRSFDPNRSNVFSTRRKIRIFSSLFVETNRRLSVVNHRKRWNIRRNFVVIRSNWTWRSKRQTSVKKWKQNQTQRTSTFVFLSERLFYKRRWISSMIFFEFMKVYRRSSKSFDLFNRFFRNSVKRQNHRRSKFDSNIFLFPLIFVLFFSQNASKLKNSSKLFIKSNEKHWLKAKPKRKFCRCLSHDSARCKISSFFKFLRRFVFVSDTKERRIVEHRKITSNERNFVKT